MFFEPSVEAHEGDQVAEVVVEVRDPGLEGAAEERLVESDLPALGLLGLEIGIAGNSEAAELVEEARRLDALAPGAVQPRLGDGHDGGQRDPRRERLAECGAVVVAATPVEEDAVPPGQLQLAVAGPGVAALVGRIGSTEGRVDVLHEVLLLVAGPDDDGRRDLDHLRRRHHRVVVEEEAVLRGLVDRVGPGKVGRHVDGIAEAGGLGIAADLEPMLEPRGLAVPHAQAPHEPRALLGLVGIGEGLEQVARALGREVKDAVDVASRQREGEIGDRLEVEAQRRRVVREGIVDLEDSAGVRVPELEEGAAETVPQEAPMRSSSVE